MKCEQIQDLLLTDYLDGVLNEDLRKKVDAHVQGCPTCLEFKRVAVRTTVDVFQDVERKTLPDHIWSKIEAGLGQESQEAIPARVPFWEYLKSLFANPVPAIGLIACFIIAGVSVNQFQGRQAQLNQKSKEFLVSVMNSSSNVLISDEDGLGTNEELLFL